MRPWGVCWWYYNTHAPIHTITITHYSCTPHHTKSYKNTALVGQLGTVELAAVGLGSVFYIFLVFCFSTFQVTTTSLVGAATARNNRAQVRHAAAWCGAWVLHGVGHGCCMIMPACVVVCMDIPVHICQKHASPDMLATSFNAHTTFQ